MKPLKLKASITLDSDVIEKIKALAENDGRSFSQYINHVLKAHLDAVNTKATPHKERVDGNEMDSRAE